MMKRFAVILLAALCALSMTACGSKKTTQKEIEKAIYDGTLTVEDALEKKWITEEWAAEYEASRTVEAVSKEDAHHVQDFTTTTLSDEEFTKKNLSDVTFWAFLDPQSEGAQEFFNAMVEANDGVEENGGHLVACLKGEEGTEGFADAPFPVILYNDSVKEAVQNNAEMIEGIENTGSWYLHEAFYTAWYSKADAADLIDRAKDISETAGNQESSQIQGGFTVMG